MRRKGKEKSCFIRIHYKWFIDWSFRLVVLLLKTAYVFSADDRRSKRKIFIADATEKVMKIDTFVFRTNHFNWFVQFLTGRRSKKGQMTISFWTYIVRLIREAIENWGIEKRRQPKCFLEKKMNGKFNRKICFSSNKQSSMRAKEKRLPVVYWYFGTFSRAYNFQFLVLIKIYDLT